MVCPCFTRRFGVRRILNGAGGRGRQHGIDGIGHEKKRDERYVDSSRGRHRVATSSWKELPGHSPPGYNCMTGSGRAPTAPALLIRRPRCIRFQQVPGVTLFFILVAVVAALAIGFAIGRWQRPHAPEAPAPVAALVSAPTSPPARRSRRRSAAACRRARGGTRGDRTLPRSHRRHREQCAATADGSRCAG